MFAALLGTRPKLKKAAQTGFEAIMAQARQPYFYTDLGVDDTFEGRFELAVLHAALAMRRWRELDKDGADLAQATFDRLFSSFDYALRETGTGDLSVGKKIRKLGEAFYGRARAYDQMLGAEDPQKETIAALERNGIGKSEAHWNALASYILKSKQALASMEPNILLTGQVDWPMPDDCL